MVIRSGGKIVVDGGGAARLVEGDGRVPLCDTEHLSVVVAELPKSLLLQPTRALTSKM